MVTSRHPINLLSQHIKGWKNKYLVKYQDQKLKKAARVQTLKSKERCNRRIKRKRSKAKYSEKRLKVKMARSNELQNAINFINTEDKPEDVIDQMKGKENNQVKGDKREKSSVKLEKISFEDETKFYLRREVILNWNSIRMIFLILCLQPLMIFIRVMRKNRIKWKAVYFIQHIWEEYLIFWLSQLDKISLFARIKKVMKAFF